jgi:hypothetical protein
MKMTKNTHAAGCFSITGLATSLVQPSSVITVNRVHSEWPSVPNRLGLSSPNSLVPITANT